LFSLFGRSLRGPARATRAVVETAVSKPGSPSPAPEPLNRVAVIQGRFCLAYTSFCTVCAERCPVPGAMKVEQGIPMVVPDTCTGCGVCHDVCPAPTNAVLVIPRQRTPRFIQPPPSAPT
jgi:Na+-translocating ferredoxin:NAD+ oxidoreductase RNF subunit RnfB